MTTFNVGDRVVFKFDLFNNRWGRGVVTAIDVPQHPEVQGEKLFTIRSDACNGAFTHKVSSLYVNPESEGPTR